MSTNSSKQTQVSRRGFLKAGGGVGLSLCLSQLSGVLSQSFVKSVLAAETTVQYDSWSDLYRNEWKWDKVTWGSHSNVCLPGGCSFRVYTKNGVVWREEQVAKSPASNPKYPDYNPLGCQKGCGYHNVLYGGERVKYPMKRVGKRGGGSWKRISWDEALTDVADSIIDACEKYGPETVILDAPHVHEGAVAWAAAFRFNRLIGGISPDCNIEIGDVFMGMFETLGKMHFGYTPDNFFDADIVFLTCSNWSYTMPALYHFLSEARYNGTEIVSIAPDYSPTTPVSDTHIPVKVATDAAFWLGCCSVMIEEKLYDAAFIKEQTDLPLLVRKDTDQYLRASDVEEGGAENQLYFYDKATSGLAKAPRGTLRFDGDQALEGTYEIRLKNGAAVKVSPVFEHVKAHLQNYTPEKASKICGVDPALMREYGRKIAKKRVCTYVGFSSAKHYHGDLMERSLLLAMALSGNWGKPGTGLTIWSFTAVGMEALIFMDKPVAEGGLKGLHALHEDTRKKVLASDPTATEEIVTIGVIQEVTKELGVVPPTMFLHNHAGYEDLWNNKAYQDPALKRSFTECLNESIEKGWWGKDELQPPKGVDPQVSLQIAHNPLRRLRQGMNQYPGVYYPKLKMLWTIEPRMSSSAMFCDVVLPAAWYYEKWDMSICITSNPRIAFIEKAVEPQGEARDEWAIFVNLTKKIGERAKERGLAGYKDRNGVLRNYADLHDKFTMGGKLVTGEQALIEMVEVSSHAGLFPPGYSMKEFRRDGQVAIQNMGSGFLKECVASEYSPDKPFYSLHDHVHNKRVYPTYARRAQFFIDHPWYMEAGEALPTYKTVPQIGGDHPFMITGGHPRVSVHSTHLSNEHFLQLHRGQPVVHINDKEAAKRGIKNGDTVVMFNDVNETTLMARTTPAVRPDQVIVYFWEAYQFKEWKVYDNMLVGQPKSLHLAGGYDQIGRYYFLNGTPSPCSDRGVRVDVRKA